MERNKAIAAESTGKTFFRWCRVPVLITIAARKALEDSEKAIVQATAERKAIQGRLTEAEKVLMGLEGRIQKSSASESSLMAEKRRLEQEISTDRERYQSDLAERDFAIDQTQKKYQSETYYPLFLLKPTPWLQRNLLN